MTGLQPAGFSHSEIRGSKLICSSPRLIAAYHVLHRLLVPRHPPYALSNLTLIVLRASRLKRLLYSVIPFYVVSSPARARPCLRTSALPRDESTPQFVYGNIHHVKEQLLSPLRGLVCTTVASGQQKNSGVSRIRTGDPLLAKQVLYQLSYNPA